MPTELVVREPFGLDGKIYARGEHISDQSLIPAITQRFPTHVRAINVAAPAPGGERVAEGAR